MYDKCTIDRYARTESISFPLIRITNNTYIIIDQKRQIFIGLVYKISKNCFLQKATTKRLLYSTLIFPELVNSITEIHDFQLVHAWTLHNRNHQHFINKTSNKQNIFQKSFKLQERANPWNLSKKLYCNFL